MLNFKEYSVQFDTMVESIILTAEELNSIEERVKHTHTHQEPANFNQRILKQNRTVRRRSRLTLQRKIQNMKIASPARLQNRSMQRARRLIIQRLYNGRSRSQIPLAQRKQLDVRMKRMQGGVKSTAYRLLRRVRQDDRSRKTHYKNPTWASKNRMVSF